MQPTAKQRVSVRMHGAMVLKFENADGKLERHIVDAGQVVDMPLAYARDLVDVRKAAEAYDGHKAALPADLLEAQAPAAAATAPPRARTLGQQPTTPEPGAKAAAEAPAPSRLAAAIRG